MAAGSGGSLGSGDGKRQGFGTLEVVTGGGKSLIALECAARVARFTPGLKLAIVVPNTSAGAPVAGRSPEPNVFSDKDVSILGGGGTGDLSGCRALVAVLNSAAKKLPTMAQANQPLMLIVDECHRAGAPKFSRVLERPRSFVLGLSATPDREDIDDNGEPLTLRRAGSWAELGRRRLRLRTQRGSRTRVVA